MATENQKSQDPRMYFLGECFSNKKSRLILQMIIGHACRRKEAPAQYFFVPKKRI